MKDIQEQITNEITQGLSNEFDKIFLKGLDLKGFTFENRIDAEKFIKENCRCADDLHNQQKTFYINEIPFLLHVYKIEIEPIVNFERKTSITANYGYYKYL
jgi:hypothetical protein